MGEGDRLWAGKTLVPTLRELSFGFLKPFVTISAREVQRASILPPKVRR